MISRVRCRYSSPLALLLACALGLGVPATPTMAMTEREALVVARLLALLLDSGRVVLATHQAMINDPSKGQKGFTPQLFEQEVIEEFQRRSGGIDLKHLDASPVPLQGQALLTGLLDAGTEVIQERQAIINERFLGYKNVIPATWGTWTSEKFSMRNQLRLKQTALDFRNPNNAPDAFEADMLARFAEPTYPREDEHIASEVTEGGTKLRLLLPLFHKRECLACHGAPKGATDIAGYLQEGHVEGEPAGAISVALPIAP